MQLRLFSTLIVSAFAVMALNSARADDGPWEVRLRAAYLDPANNSNSVDDLVPANAVHINEKWMPDLNFEYFFTPNWSAELVLTYPVTMHVTVGGTPIGTFKLLPPTLTGKYNFLPNSNFQPYVGAGVNFSIMSDQSLAVPGVSALKINSTAVGYALQTGFDYKIRDHWYANMDVKWMALGTDVYLPGQIRISTLHINPWLFGIGIGYRFGGH